MIAVSTIFGVLASHALGAKIRCLARNSARSLTACSKDMRNPLIPHEGVPHKPFAVDQAPAGAIMNSNLENFQILGQQNISGDRKADPQTGQVPPVGSTVDLKNATWTNTIGAPKLTAFWQDAEFNPAEHAF